VNITGNSVSVAAASHLKSAATKIVSSGGSQLNTDPGTGSVSLSSSSGSVNVSGTSITTHYLTLHSGDGILLDGSGQSFTASGSGSTAKFTAPNLITVNNADLSGFEIVNMAANTINLFNVAFSGTVSLNSLLGILHYGSGMYGAVNFINVYYNGQLITPETAPEGMSGQIQGTQIFIGSTSGGGGGVSSGAISSSVLASGWGSHSQAPVAPNLNASKGIK
jgi:hypothetical protein